MGEQTYHRSESSKRSGVGDQASQGVLLARPVDDMSVVSHHDWHLLHHLDSSLAPTAKRQRRGWMRIRRWRRKRRGVQLTGFVSLWEWRRRLAAFKSPSGAGPRPLRGGGAGEWEAVQHTCLFLSLPLCNARRVWQRRMSLLFLPFHWVSTSPSLTRLYSGGFLFCFLLLAKIKFEPCLHIYAVCMCVFEVKRDRKEVVRSTTVTCRS